MENNQMKCDVCGETEGVECEVLLTGEQVDRIYHLCPEHWIKVYRKTLEDFLESNEYRCNTYIKMAADKLISDSLTKNKVISYSDDDGFIDIGELTPKEIRKLRPYELDGIGEE